MAKVKVDKQEKAKIPVRANEPDSEGWRDLGRKFPAFTRLDVGDVLTGKLVNAQTSFQNDKKGKKGGREKINLEFALTAGGTFTRGKKKEAKRVDVPVGEVVSVSMDGNLPYLLNDGLEAVGAMPLDDSMKLRAADLTPFRDKEFRIVRTEDVEMTRGRFKGKDRKNYALKMRA